MRKKSSRLEQHEIITIRLYQEKMAYYQNLLDRTTDDMLTQRGLDPLACAIEMPTGKITKRPKIENKEAQ